MAKYRIILFLLLILSVFVVGMYLINSGESSTVIDDSPYPEFVYIDGEILPEISKIFANVDIPPFLFYFIEGVYIDGEEPEGVAIKTPLWQVAKIIKMLNIFNEELENIHPENGFLFINSEYKGAPEKDYRCNYITQDSDIIAYLNDSVFCANFERDDITYLNISISKDRIPYRDIGEEKMIVKILKGLKSINGIKVIRSNAWMEGDMLVINLVLKTGISDIRKLLNIDFSYVPITVKVKGDWIKINENKYIKNSDYMMIYTLPLDSNTTLSMIDERKELYLDIDLKDLKEVKEYHYQGWYVKEYLYSYMGYTIKLYICTKELEYGTVCVITNRLENLEDIKIYELT